MENITIYALAGGFVLLISFLKSLQWLQKQTKEATKSMLAGEFAAVNQKIDDLQADMNERLEALERSQEELKEAQEEAAIEACKNFLTHALVDVENGADDEVLKKRIHSSHGWYIEHHQNSYIDAKFNKLVAEGKL